MRKKIVAILLTAAMAMGIAACGNQSESNKEAKKDDNTITVWCWDKTFNIFAMEEAAKIYQEDHQYIITKAYCYNLRWTTSLRKKHSYKCCKERPS